MHIAGFAAGAWQTNCWVVAPARNSECVIVDPGMDALDQLREVLARDNLKPVAVLVTHGHIDHMWSVFPVADGYNIPAFIHSADADLLADPVPALGPQGRSIVEQLGASFTRPEDVRELAHLDTLNLLGMDFTVHHRPGHTAGCVTYTVKGQSPVMFSGDVLFKNAIGRTDLPTGDPRAMRKSLTDLLQDTADNTVIHPGHGESSVMFDERNNNPYLLNLDYVTTEVM